VKVVLKDEILGAQLIETAKMILTTWEQMRVDKMMIDRKKMKGGNAE